MTLGFSSPPAYLSNLLKEALPSASAWLDGTCRWPGVYRGEKENPKMGRCGYEGRRDKGWTGKLQINFGSKCSGSVWAEATRRWGWSISAGCEALERCSQAEGKSPALGISHNLCLETGGKLRWLFEIFLHDMRIALTLGQCYPKSGPQAGPWRDKRKHWEQTLGNIYNNLTD